MKFLFLIILIVCGCAAPRYSIETRQYGLHECIPEINGIIIKIDTIKNEHGGILKEIIIKVKTK